ncbi:MAG TPA: hypothetical protein DCS97_07720 [Planctomycetes bacterium]|nr:hypothetical protein [Planctomycetota bacterium]
MHGTAPPGRWCRTLGDEDVRQLVALLGELHAAHDDPIRFNHGLRYLIAQAWTAFERAPATPTRHPAIAAADRALSADPGLALGELARLGGTSQRRLSALLRAATGSGLAALRNRHRVERALVLARQGMALADAARAAGFCSYRQFHRSCRQVTGVSPRAARMPG